MKILSNPFLHLLISLAFVLPGITFNQPDTLPDHGPVIQQIQLTPMAPAGPETNDVFQSGKSQVLYFYSENCPHCQLVYDNILLPFINAHADQMQLWTLPIDIPANYETLLQIESAFNIQPAQRGLPTTLIGDKLIIGEEQSNQQLETLLLQTSNQSQAILPALPGFDPSQLQYSEVNFTDVEFCTEEDPSACETGQPIYAAYFYQVGCKSCSRAEADLLYLQSKYPNLIIDEFNIYDQAGLGDWMAAQSERTEDFHSPAIFINRQAWIGEEEITPQAIEETLIGLSKNGSERYWEAYDPDQDSNSILNRFRSMGWLTVVAAGLIDGLNPCAFATLIFFISYLTISGRKGKDIILVGISFTLGVFVAYLAIGMGFYKVLDALGNWLKIVGQWVIGLTGVFCLTLAFFALKDYFKARKGDIGDMSLNLPHGLRKRINQVIRQGKSNRFYIGGAFVTGLIISVLELACTGQIYLPTIIFVSSIPEMKLQAFSYLLLYNLLFIAPLVVVFVLAYYGTTSKDLTNFLQKNAARVKLGMVFLFFALGSWMIYSLF